MSAVSRRTKSALWFLIGAAGTALLLAVIYALLAGAQYSKDSAQTTEAIRETQIDNHTLLDTIQDCTQTTGKCHRRGLQQTAGAVSSINRQTVATAACTVILSRQSTAWSAEQLAAEINKCANETVARLDTKR